MEKLRFLGLVVFLGAILSAFSSAKKPANADGVWVVRPDGSKQCEEGGARDLAAEKKLLEESNIRVLEAKKWHDGKMRAQMCGLVTGHMNAVMIPKSDLPKAQSLKFVPAPKSFSESTAKR